MIPAGLILNWALQAARNAPSGVQKFGAWLKKPSNKQLIKAADEARKRDKLAEDRRRYCAQCKTEIINCDAAFCPTCGSSSISSREERRKWEMAEEKRKRQQGEKEEQKIRAVKACEERQRLEQKQTEIRRGAAGKRCQELTTLKFCNDCRIERGKTDGFCIKCGGVLGMIPAEVAFAMAKKEFPDQVPTMGAFVNFCNDHAS